MPLLECFQSRVWYYSWMIFLSSVETLYWVSISAMGRHFPKAPYLSHDGEWALLVAFISVLGRTFPCIIPSMLVRGLVFGCLSQHQWWECLLTLYSSSVRGTFPWGFYNLPWCCGSSLSSSAQLLGSSWGGALSQPIRDFTWCPAQH